MSLQSLQTREAKQYVVMMFINYLYKFHEYDQFRIFLLDCNLFLSLALALKIIMLFLILTLIFAHKLCVLLLFCLSQNFIFILSFFCTNYNINMRQI